VLLPPNPKNNCFGCGDRNARGMKLTFEQDDAARHIRGVFALGAEYEGGPGFIHGGIIATVLDEAMGKVSRFRQVRAVTAELNVEYLRPVPVERMLRVEAFELEAKGRSLLIQGEIWDAATNHLLARSKGRFVTLLESDVRNLEAKAAREKAATEAAS
jgi:acyl-coenzyme A thioesterase PaaI-like protein